MKIKTEVLKGYITDFINNLGVYCLLCWLIIYAFKPDIIKTTFCLIAFFSAVICMYQIL